MEEKTLSLRIKLPYSSKSYSKYINTDLPLNFTIAKVINMLSKRKTGFGSFITDPSKYSFLIRGKILPPNLTLEDLCEKYKYKPKEVLLFTRIDFIFIIMPFRDKILTDSYNQFIKNPLLKEGYFTRRGDDYFESHDIMSAVLDSISKSDIIIADISNSNPNVMYELGIARQLKKHIIQVCNSDNKDVPFDIKNFRTIFYENSMEGFILLYESIKKYIETYLFTSRYELFFTKIDILMENKEFHKADSEIKNFKSEFIINDSTILLRLETLLKIIKNNIRSEFLPIQSRIRMEFYFIRADLIKGNLSIVQDKLEAIYLKAREIGLGYNLSIEINYHNLVTFLLKKLTLNLGISLQKVSELEFSHTYKLFDSVVIKEAFKSMIDLNQIHAKYVSKHIIEFDNGRNLNEKEILLEKINKEINNLEYIELRDYLFLNDKETK